MQTRTFCHPSKDGIALVLVLGILSILLILGVAFATALRTEQIATRNSIDSLRARQLIDVAVNEAMETIDSDRDATLGDGAFYMTSRSQEVVDRVFQSSSGSGKSFAASNLLSGTAALFLPRGVRNDALNAGDPEWIPIESPSAALTAPGFTGQVAFIVVDVSDYIDGNLAGGWSRNYGTNVGEVALLDVDSAADLSTFTNLRESAWGEFDTLPDIEMIAEPYLAGDPGENHLMQPFSYFPKGYWNISAQSATPHFDIRSAISGGNHNSIDKDSIDLSKIEQAIRDSDVAPAISHDLSRVRRLAANIRDYLDNDNVPGNDLFTESAVQTASFCTEAVPMINEVRLSNQLETRVIAAGVTNWYSRIRLDVEVWFPFVGVNTRPDDFTVELWGLTIGRVVNAPTLDLNVRRGQETLLKQPGQAGYQVYSYLKELESTQKPDFSSVQARIEVAVVDDLNSSATVDHLIFGVESGTWADLFANPTIPPASGATVTGYLDRQVDDPRINWDWANHWTAPTDLDAHTLGAPNADFLTYDSSVDQDGDTVMYVRNGLYRSAGELGQLLYDETKPWQTIRLLGPDIERTGMLVEHFAASTNEQGYVNLNSGEQDVLAAVFYDSPVRRVPDEIPVIPPLTIEEARNIANVILTHGVNSGSEFFHRGYLTSIPAADIMAVVPRIATAALAESVVSDAYGLLGTRQNLFAVIAIAQTFAPKSRVVTAERRAAALVWRDPLENPAAAGNGRHSTFVRNLVWLNE
jgi:hypothetical protein